MTSLEHKATPDTDPALPPYMTTYAELEFRLRALRAAREDGGPEGALVRIACFEACRDAAREHGRAVQGWLTRSVESLLTVYRLGDDQVATAFRGHHQIVLSLHQIDKAPRVHVTLCEGHTPLLSASAPSSDPEAALSRLRMKMRNDPLCIGLLRHWPELGVGNG